MARSTIMMAKSGMLKKTKWETVVNKLLLRLLNTTQYVEIARVESIKETNSYMITMKKSGYSEKVRRDTVLAAYKGLYEKFRQRDEDGVRFHRHK